VRATLTDANDQEENKAIYHRSHTSARFLLDGYKYSYKNRRVSGCRCVRVCEKERMTRKKRDSSVSVFVLFNAFIIILSVLPQQVLFLPFFPSSPPLSCLSATGTTQALRFSFVFSFALTFDGKEKHALDLTHFRCFPGISTKRKRNSLAG
jgi:hypothetical protein